MDLLKARKKQKKFRNKKEEVIVEDKKITLSKLTNPSIPVIYVLFGSHIFVEGQGNIYISGHKLRQLYGLPTAACRYVEAHEITKVNTLAIVEPASNYIYLYARQKGDYKERLEVLQAIHGVENGCIKPRANRRSRAGSKRKI